MAITTGKPDLVLFAGPVILKEEFDNVDWKRPTVVEAVHAPADISSSYRQLGTKSLDEIVSEYVGGTAADYDKIALAAYSKGGSFVDQLLRIRGNRDRVSAVILNDAVFGSQLDGLSSFLQQAAAGEKLMVVTNSNNQASPSLPKRARESVEDMIGPQVGNALVSVDPAPGMLIPSGGVWSLGDFYWYDYVQPNGVNDISHGAHHDLAPETWQAHLAPYLDRGGAKFLLALASVAALVGISVWVSRRA